MTKANNPAQRLLTILKAARDRPDGKAEVAWCDILSVESGKNPQLLRRLGLVLDLPNKIKEEIEKISGIDHDVYLKWMPAVQSSFSNINLGRNFNEFKNPLSDHTIYGLEVCAELLSRHSAEKILNPTDLKELDAEVTKLFDALLDSDLHPDLKSFILTRLDEIHLAILDYEFAGPKPLQRAVEAVVGSALFEKQKYDRFAGTEHYKAFWKIISKAALIVTIVSGTLQIADGLKKVLPERDVSSMDEIIIETEDVEQDESTVPSEATPSSSSDVR